MTSDALVKTAIFCDFDGTVSRRDIGYHLFRHFSGGRNEELVPLWKERRITTRECLRREVEMVEAREEDIYRFLDGFELSPGFADFVARCRHRRVDLTILSDGMDFYIDYVLSRHGLGYLPVVANHGFFEEGRLAISFPYGNASCERCGSCKGERIREYRRRCGEAIRAVFVGDGYSDICAVEEADLVFAKKDLERYCRGHDIPFTQYGDFTDIIQHLIGLGILADSTGHATDGD